MLRHHAGFCTSRCCPFTMIRASRTVPAPPVGHHPRDDMFAISMLIRVQLIKRCMSERAPPDPVTFLPATPCTIVLSTW